MLRKILARTADVMGEYTSRTDKYLNGNDTVPGLGDICRAHYKIGALRAEQDKPKQPKVLSREYKAYMRSICERDGLDVPEEWQE